MKMIRVLKKSFINSTIIEAGETTFVEDNFPLGPHMVDVAAEQRGEEIPPYVEPQHVPTFLDHSADVITPMGVVQRDASSPHLDPQAESPPGHPPNGD